MGVERSQEPWYAMNACPWKTKGKAPMEGQSVGSGAEALKKVIPVHWGAVNY